MKAKLIPLPDLRDVSCFSPILFLATGEKAGLLGPLFLPNDKGLLTSTVVAAQCTATLSGKLTLFSTFQRWMRCM